MSVLEQVISWANTELPAWQSDIVRRLLEADSLTAKDHTEILLMAKHAMHIPFTGTAQTPVQPTSKDPTAGSGTGSGIALAAIKDLKNVNRIKNGSGINFSKSGLNVVFGYNGAGKSGYARILKLACKARDKTESIIGNVFSDDKTNPSAVIDIDDGTQTHSIDWNHQGAADARLSTIAVFDSHCSRLIVDEQSDIEYLPYGSQVFTDLVECLNHIKTTLQSEIPKLEAIKESGIEEGTEAANFLTTLSAKLELADIEKSTSWTEANDKELNDREAQLALAKSGNADAEIKKLQKVQEQVTASKARYQTFSEAIDEKTRIAAMAEIGRVVELRGALEILAKEKEGLQVLPGVGDSAQWRTLYEAAKKYSEVVAYKGKPFPYVSDDARCVLCLRELDQEARIKFGLFKQHMESALSTDHASAVEAVNKRIRGIEGAQELPKEQVETLGTALGDSHKDSVATIIASIGAASSRREALVKALKELDKDATIPGSVSAEAVFTAIDGNVATQIKTLKDAQKPEELAKLETTVKAGRGRKALSKRKTDIVKYVTDAKLGQVIEAGIKSLRTTEITVKGKDIISAAIKPALGKALKTELDSLGVSGFQVEVVTGGSSGKTKVQLSLGGAKLAKGVKLTKVLSEGEQRVVGVAGFLAELGLEVGTRSIVFDDPVSSLDHRYRRAIAIRLVEESLKRQVIIFTHDLAFLVELMTAQTEAERRGKPVTSSVIQLTRGAIETGIVHNEQPIPWNAMTTTQRVEFLKKQLSSIKSLFTSDRPSYNAKAENIYGDLREAWEGAVEEDLFYGVVRRYRLEIRTLTLWEVSIVDEDIATLDDCMSKCSRWMKGHKAPGDEIEDKPDPQEIEADIQKLSDWFNAIKKRRSETKRVREEKYGKKEGASAKVI